jgi:site-specific recombinase XerC
MNTTQHSVRTGNSGDLVKLVNEVLDMFPPDTQEQALRELIMAATLRHSQVVGVDVTAILYIAGLLTLTEQGITGSLKELMDSDAEAKSLIEKLRGAQD